MTVVIVLSDCPAKLRGDLSKWFFEINTGVYVGNVSARVRDEIWIRIIENIGRGHATMVFGAPGEQHMDFRVHNSYWLPTDYDGIKLMLRPARLVGEARSAQAPPGFSKAAKHRAAGKTARPDKLSGFLATSYVVLDFETTGLDETRDEIIEMAALLVERGNVVEKMQHLVQCSGSIPAEITQLTGITENDLQKEGLPPDIALEKLREFAEDFPFVCHNAAFEERFLSSACLKTGADPFENRMIDTLKFSQQVLPDLQDHKLSSVAGHLSVPCTLRHRALSDCETTYGIYNKLIELASVEMRKSEK